MDEACSLGCQDFSAINPLRGDGQHARDRTIRDPARCDSKMQDHRDFCNTHCFRRHSIILAGRRSFETLPIYLSSPSIYTRGPGESSLVPLLLTIKSAPHGHRGLCEYILLGFSVFVSMSPCYTICFGLELDMSIPCTRLRRAPQHT